MERIPLSLEEHLDRDKLEAFLESCRDAAEDDAHAKLVSINLSVDHVDPLAVIDSIYEDAASHFYLENPRKGWALAGAESVLETQAEGPERFRRLKETALEWDAHTISVGDLDLSFSGPAWMAGFAFFDEVGSGEGFPVASAFVPQWQVARSGGRFLATVNLLIAAETAIRPLAERIWQAHRTFSSLDYEGPPPAPRYTVVKEAEVGPESHYTEIVKAALEQIRSGAYDKIVLARAIDLTFDTPCAPLRILDRLRRRFPECSSFSLQNSLGTRFIGATPESLIGVDKGTFCTEAIAGSAPRGEGAVDDAREAGALLRSAKDLREHQHVVASILKRLHQLGLDASSPEAPELYPLANVQHLRTPIKGRLCGDQHILDLAENLHPTPAVGGTPREAVLGDIRQWEPFARGLFAGLVGWYDAAGNGELIVGIRSALIRGEQARIYAGAGIVEGSDPEREWHETQVKMEALLNSVKQG
jgi:menaquinone-specific isochorismate synthase